MRVFELKKDHTKQDLKIDYKNELNPQQQEAVFKAGDKTLVLSGPGSGKTRVLVYRVAYLIEQGVRPDEILLLTFTNKAAKNMFGRVEELLGYFPQGLMGGTFHHVGNLLLRKHAELLGFKDNYSIIDKEDSKLLIKEIISEVKASKHFPSEGVVQNIIGYSKNTLKPIEVCIKENYPERGVFTKAIKDVYNKYEKRKQKANLFDFDDLLWYWNKLLGIPEMQDKYARIFKHILVDEFQDTNKLQFDLLKKLTVGYDNHLMVVGDDCQSIYAFRGAEIENILEFPKVYKKHDEHKLEINYRSTPEILNLINKSIQNNINQFEKKLRTPNKKGALPACVRCKNAQQEAEFVGQHILNLREEGSSYDEMGVLYRANYQSALIEMELTKRGIPYKKRGGLKFFAQAHIKTMSAFLKILNNSTDELAWKRILMLFEGIGPKKATELWEQIKKHKDSVEFITSKQNLKLSQKATLGWNEFKKTVSKAISREQLPGERARVFYDMFYEQHLKEHYPDFKDRSLDLQQYMNLADQYRSIDNFLEDIVLDADLTNKEDPVLVGESGVSYKTEEEAVILSTIHQAKGLEWDSVFVIGLAEGIFPSGHSFVEDTVEEERRLFYVACSRAKRGLFLSLPMESSTAYGGNKILRDSQFIEELPQECYEPWVIHEATTSSQSENSRKQIINGNPKKQKREGYSKGLINNSYARETKNQQLIPCPNCGINTEKSDSFCPHCGKDLKPIFIPQVNNKKVILLSIWFIASNLFGLLFLFAGVSSLFKNFFFGFVLLTIGALSFSTTSIYIHKKINRNFTNKEKIAIWISLFFLLVSLTPAT